ncbi:MAG: hypothetical protein EON59_02905 [Alphaproteobacteria bacterium]|nr:MAG: hypothetical protein EON59_02905 [Alphaproteobacteria bacterium]
MENQIVPWFPLPDLPQTPCGIQVEGGPEQLEVRAIYSFYGSGRDLLIGFNAEVFGCFSEIAAPDTFVRDDYPRLKHAKYADYLWPLMEVTNSSWLASYRDRLWAPDHTYRHYRIVSEDGTFDALTWQEPAPQWAIPKT